MKKSIVVFSTIPALVVGAIAPAGAAEGSQVQYSASASSSSSSGGLSGLLSKIFGGSSDADDSDDSSAKRSKTATPTDPASEPSHVQDGDVAQTAGGSFVESGRATVFDDFNSYRAGKQLGGISTDDELEKRAQDWVDHLSATNGMGHSEISSPDLGEVIAFTNNPDDVINMWDKSPGHHDIINKSEATKAGIGVAKHADYGQVFVMILR